jgi:hypothetical protein
VSVEASVGRVNVGRPSLTLRNGVNVVGVARSICWKNG